MGHVLWRGKCSLYKAGRELITFILADICFMRSVSWSCHFLTLLHIFCSSLRKDGAACVPLRLGLCGLCGSIVLLCRRVPWYGRYSFALIWNWIRGAGEGGRDDEEYQSCCLLCEVICGSTESAIMKVHLFTTEGLWVNLLSPRWGTWKNGSKSSAEEVLSIQFWPLLTSAHTDTAPALAGVSGCAALGSDGDRSVLFYPPPLVQS